MLDSPLAREAMKRGSARLILNTTSVVHLILRLYAANIDGSSSCYLMGFVRGLFVHRLGKNGSDALDDQLRIIFLM
jgi:hypothetical protein